MSDPLGVHAPSGSCEAEHVFGMPVSDVVAVATVLLFDRSGGCGTWPVSGWSEPMAKHQVPASRSDQPGWLPILDHCMQRARTWRVPPRWSACDWFDELQAEGAAAAIQAKCAYDPGRGVPLGKYIHLYVLHRLLRRNHKEWSYALRLVCAPEMPEYSIEDVPCSPSESDDLQVALARLIESDRWLIDRLYWRGETEFEVGSSLGISQQAVSKKKRSVLHKLRRLLNQMESSASGGETPSGSSSTVVARFST